MTEEQWTTSIKQACPNRVGDSIFIPDWALWSTATGYLLYGNRRRLLISVGADGWVSLTDDNRGACDDTVVERSDAPETGGWLRRLLPGVFGGVAVGHRAARSAA